jgi:hypothetical protein
MEVFFSSEIFIFQGELFFSIYLSLPAAIVPGVQSASNRNVYQKQKNNIYGE